MRRPIALADHALVVYLDGVSDPDAQFARELFGDDGASVIEDERLMSDTLAQGVEVPEDGKVAWHGDRCAYVLVGSPARDDGVFAAHVRRLRHDVGARQDVLDDARVSRTLLVACLYLEVEMLYLPELLLDDVVDATSQAQAREQQCRATCDADDRHEEAALVAEEVARRHLARKR